MKNLLHRKVLGISVALIAAILALVVVAGSLFAYSQFQSIKVTNTNSFTTEAVAVTSLVVTPSPIPYNLEVGESQQFTATATYNDGDVVDVTSSATWSVSFISVAGDVSLSGSTVTGMKVGTAALQASFGGKSSNYVKINVIDTHDYTVNGVVAVTDSATVAGTFTVVKSNGHASSIIYADKSYQADMVITVVNNGSTAITGWTVTPSGIIPAGATTTTISQTAIAAGATGTVTISVTGTAPTSGAVDFSGLVCTIIPN